MDRLTPEQRHKAMSRIRGRDTSIEVLLRKALWKQGLRYRISYKKAPGHPDIAMPKYKLAIFCDGEFFHGYQWESLQEKIRTGDNADYWLPKIQRNMERDAQVNRQLEEMGWTVLRFWGKEIQKDTSGCIEKILEAIEGKVAPS